jgi:hypothetical protein
MIPELQHSCELAVETMREARGEILALRGENASLTKRWHNQQDIAGDALLRCQSLLEEVARLRKALEDRGRFVDGYVKGRKEGMERAAEVAIHVRYPRQDCEPEEANCFAEMTTAIVNQIEAEAAKAALGGE